MISFRGKCNEGNKVLSVKEKAYHLILYHFCMFLFKLSFFRKRLSLGQ